MVSAVSGRALVTTGAAPSPPEAGSGPAGVSGGPPERLPAGCPHPRCAAGATPTAALPATAAPAGVLTPATAAQDIVAALSRSTLMRWRKRVIVPFPQAVRQSSEFDNDVRSRGNDPARRLGLSSHCAELLELFCPYPCLSLRQRPRPGACLARRRRFSTAGQQRADVLNAPERRATAQQPAHQGERASAEDEAHLPGTPGRPARAQRPLQSGWRLRCLLHEVRKIVQHDRDRRP